MPQELPTSVCVTVTTAKERLDVPLQSTPTVVINTNTILTSVCDTLLTSKSTPSTPVSNSTINVIVVPASTVSTKVSETESSTVSSTSSHQYKLTEIVNQDKDMWFKQEKNSDFELEPPRGEVLSVRRRSRQFFTLIEEDEVDGETASTLALPDSDQKTSEVQVDPILNLGDSLRRLYFPQEHPHHRRKKHRAKKHVDSDNKRENCRPSSASSDPPLSAGYDSDGGKVGLFERVYQNPELRSFRSNPCINEIPDLDCSEILTVGGRQSKSLPTTPRVSPKLLRKTSMAVEKKSEPKGPGFSFLASVAGDMRLNKLKREQMHDQEMQRSKKHGIVTNSNTSVVPNQSSSVVSSSIDTNMHHELEHTHHVSDFSDYFGQDMKYEKSKPFMQSFLDWGTQKKVKVTNKETNMFSPTSF